MRQKTQMAREMTDEINRATDMAVAADGELENLGRSGGEYGTGTGVNAERARGLGGLAMGQVLTYNPEAQGRGEMENGLRGVERLEHPAARERAENERVREIAEVDNGYARNEISPSLSSVGEASALEEAERLARDRENLNAEMVPTASFEAKIQNKSQEEIGKVMAIEVGDLLKRKSFAPAEVVSLKNEGMVSMLASFKNPRVLGERN